MKKYTSVFNLIVRSSIYPVVGVLLGTAVGQILLFLFTGMDRSNLYEAVFQLRQFLPGIISLGVVLSASLCKRGGQLDYTIRRLRISDKTVFWMQAGYNTLCFALYFMVQALVFVGMSMLFLRNHPEASHQTIFVTAYQDPIFHLVFPLENPLGWLCNGALILGLGICTAAYPFRQRRGRRSMTTFLMGLLVLFYVFIIQEDHHLGLSNAVFCIPAAVVLMFSSIAGVLWIEEEVV